MRCPTRSRPNRRTTTERPGRTLSLRARQEILNCLVSSFDELLNENFKANAETASVLQPKVMTASELQELKIEAQAREDIAKASAKDPYDESSAIKKILEELKDLEAMVDDKAAVDTMWKQVLNLAGSGPKVTVSVARYSLGQAGLCI
jgi:hypothetical protein